MNPTGHGLLVGRTVVVTRAGAQAGPLVELLEAHDASVVVVPMIEVVGPSDGGAALADALGHLDRYDWVVVTSPNAAERVRRALGGSPPPLVAAVGAATSAVLGRVDLVARRQRAAGLLDELPDGPGRVLLPQSAQAHPTLADGLRAKGWEVDVVHAYDVAGRSPTDDERSAAARADAVLLASGTAARAWVQAFGTGGSAVVAAIGPQTAGVASGVGLKVDVTATDHSPAGLVAALVAHLRRP